ncbi:MAG: hypothetical protein V4519_03910 [Patescibacteria group bacterium]
MPIPFINNGKRPYDQPTISNSHLFYLPPNTPYGNLTLKVSKILQRLDLINIKITVLNEWHERNLIELTSSDFISYNPINDHSLSDEITFWLKRTTDELISLLYIKDFYIANEEFPDILKVDCIGALINEPSQLARNIKSKYSGHISFLEILNDIANAHKHSFVNSDMNVTSLSEPQVFALTLPRNSLKNQPQFLHVHVREIIEKFNIFYGETTSELRQWPNVFEVGK